MAVRNPYNYTKPQNPMTSKPVEVPKPQVAKVNPYQQNKSADYLAQKVLVAKPQELTMMLYEGLVKFIKQGQLYIDNKDIENAHRVILRAEAIVDEFMATLDMSYDVSQGLFSLYVYINEQLLEANLKKERSYLDQALAIAEELKDTWKEAMQAM